eukprot:1342757-Pleurochrysis_carterae.AAC.1
MQMQSRACAMQLCMSAIIWSASHRAGVSAARVCAVQAAARVSSKSASAGNRRNHVQQGVDPELKRRARSHGGVRCYSAYEESRLSVRWKFWCMCPAASKRRKT